MTERPQEWPAVHLLLVCEQGDAKIEKSLEFFEVILWLFDNILHVSLRSVDSFQGAVLDQFW